MNSSSVDRRRSKLPVVVVVLALVIVALAGGGIYLWPRLASPPPQIAFAAELEVVGQAPVEIRVSDQALGLKSVTTTLTQGGNTIALGSEQFAVPVNERRLSLALAKTPGVTEGPAMLRVTARNAALRNAETVVEKPLTIDLTPPALELIAGDRYINFGGVGAIVYKVAADAATSGVKLGARFFPGFAGQIKDHPDYVFALFAHPYDAAPEERAELTATDKAGNTRTMRLSYELKDVRYKKSTIAVSDAFLQNKVAPLLHDAAARNGSAREVFVAVNRDLRKENEDRIAAITAQATPTMRWKDAFVQLSNSKVEANFADQRTYTYGGEVIDTAYHLGYDLSVTRRYPVEAANSGVVVFADDLGIYGNTVIVDHGLGLFTLYGHLSTIDVKVGDALAKRQILGKTGETGLAGGDHLHFGVYLDGVAVLPVEWWDPKWIDDNIAPKLAGRSGGEVAPAAKPVKAARRAGGKRRR